MGTQRWVRLAVAGGGAVAAAATASLIAERRVVKARKAASSRADVLGGLTGDERTVTTDDGVALHAEVDEVAPYARGGGDGPAARQRPADEQPTLVFVHGYALNLDCWHFQREYFRGKHRMVFYDQRSHGRSGRSDREHATIDQLGHDLARVIEELVPEGPVVLVGHSMGGMTVMAFAEHHRELFDARVRGVALISTTAGGMRTHRLLGPFLPDALGSQIGPRVVAGLALAPDLVDRVRRRGSNLGFLVADRFAFGDDVPASYVELVDNMLGQTSFEVLASFFPNFDTLDKFGVLDAFAGVPTYIVVGTKDRLTSVGHSRTMAERMPHATLVECAGAGHLVILERKDKVNATLQELVAAARGARESRAS